MREAGGGGGGEGRRDRKLAGDSVELDTGLAKRILGAIPIDDDDDDDDEGGGGGGTPEPEGLAEFGVPDPIDFRSRQI